MGTRQTVTPLLLGRDVALAYAILVLLYILKDIRFQPVQIPAYLLIVAYDIVEVMLPMLTPYHPIGFPLFLYLLAIFGAGAARGVRSGDGTKSTVKQICGGVCLVVGVLALLFGAFVGGPLISRMDNPTPLAITVATGMLFLVGAWWLLGQPSADPPNRA